MAEQGPYKKVSFFERQKLKRTVEKLSAELHRPPYPRYKYLPELYWLNLSTEGPKPAINEEILSKVISDTVEHLSLQDKIRGHKVLYHYLSINDPLEFPDRNPIHIDDGIVTFDYFIADLDGTGAEWLTNTGWVFEDEFLFGIIYEMVRFYLQVNHFPDLSDYYVHIAVVFCGFYNYCAPASNWGYYIFCNGKPIKRHIGYNDWSDALAIAQICHNDD